MTIQNVFDRLRPIDQAASQLLLDTGYDPDDGCLGRDVRPLPDVYEDAFYRDKAEEILDHLGEICNTLRYLRTPSHGEHILAQFPDGHYGYRDGGSDIRTFITGDRLEAKIHDKYGRKRWVLTTIEYDGADYFLRGFFDIPLDGLTVRERW